MVARRRGAPVINQVRCSRDRARGAPARRPRPAGRSLHSVAPGDEAPARSAGSRPSSRLFIASRPPGCVLKSTSPRSTRHRRALDARPFQRAGAVEAEPGKYRNVIRRPWMSRWIRARHPGSKANYGIRGSTRRSAPSPGKCNSALMGEYEISSFASASPSPTGPQCGPHQNTTNHARHTEEPSSSVSKTRMPPATSEP